MFRAWVKFVGSFKKLRKSWFVRVHLLVAFLGAVVQSFLADVAV